MSAAAEKELEQRQQNPWAGAEAAEAALDAEAARLQPAVTPLTTAPLPPMVPVQPVPQLALAPVLAAASDDATAKAARTAKRKAAKKAKKERRRELEADPGGRTALLRASRAGQSKEVRALFTRKDLNVNATDSHGVSALRIASFRGHQSVVEALLTRQDIDVNLKGSDGRTALDSAKERYLPAYGGEWNLGAEWRQWAQTTEKPNDSIVRMLEAHGAVQGDRPPRLDDEQSEGIYVSACAGNWNEVMELVWQGANVDFDCEHMPVLAFAAVEGNAEVMAFLLDQGACVNVDCYHQGITAFCYAIDSGNAECWKMLLARPDLDVNTKGAWKGKRETPLQEYVRKYSVVAALLARPDIDLEIKTGWDKDPDRVEEGDGLTALDLAKANLLEAKTKLHQPDPNAHIFNRTPQERAQELEELAAIVALLEAPREVAVPAAEEAGSETRASAGGAAAAPAAPATACSPPTAASDAAAASSSSSDDDDDDGDDE